MGYRSMRSPKEQRRSPPPTLTVLSIRFRGRSRSTVEPVAVVEPEPDPPEDPPEDPTPPEDTGMVIKPTMEIQSGTFELVGSIY